MPVQAQTVICKDRLLPVRRLDELRGGIKSAVDLENVEDGYHGVVELASDV
jgi:hypothetical protein